ncbi:hypothetical protein COU54_05855 [Candidatus Pacearchaeota archaeon CG10_big_fil_rev_8_21_14_0_10_31_24]|nr:MAG: hypothetical protein COU54_05855 [Candidatus Pacearchaeota archaeon CG10_big_fil_rev_8_21_14_0_10_31_24]
MQREKDYRKLFLEQFVSRIVSSIYIIKTYTDKDFFTKPLANKENESKNNKEIENNNSETISNEENSNEMPGDIFEHKKENEKPEEKHSKINLHLKPHSPSEKIERINLNVGHGINLPYSVASRTNKILRKPLMTKKPVIHQTLKRQLPPPMKPVPILALKKIEAIIRDPDVTSIECPGPDQPITVTSRGFSRSTPIRFSEEEMTNILKEVSQKTRIPFNKKSVFKAIIEDIIFTAMDSEYLGTKFIVQTKPKMPSSSRR